MEVGTLLNKLIAVLAMTFILLVPIAHVGAEPPSYAKWGKTAIQETSQRYPDQQITDYSYDGKVFISDVREQYDFEFTLKQNGQSREIRVYVLVNPKKDQLIGVKYDEIEEFQ